jgi:hypothetical protein
MSGPMSDISFDPWETRQGRRLRFRRRMGAAAGSLVVAALTAVLAITIFDHPHMCSAGVNRIDGECIGVTDDHSFYLKSDNRKDDLRNVRDAIKAENDWVAQQHRRAVTIAFLGPLTDRPDPTSLTGGRVPHEVEGTYIAQYRANHNPVLGSDPLIRLVLANEGVNEQHWKPVVHRLEKMTQDHDAPLSAVVGLGLSQQETADAALELSAHKIPMVGDITTADGLDATGAVLPARPRLDWLTKVAPPNRHQIQTIADHLRRYRHDLHSAIMVTDNNAHDMYNNSLRSDFATYLGDYWKRSGSVDERFEGAGRVSADDLKNIINDLCGDKRPDMVLFAGRANALNLFVQDLQQLNTIKGNACRARPLTIITGSDAAVLTLTGAQARPAARTAPQAQITVLYTPLADPNVLSSTAPYQAFLKAFTTDEPDKTAFSRNDLNDGWAISSHDAMMTAVTAIRQSRHSGRAPLPEEVLSALRHMQFSAGVNGAVDIVHLDGDGNPSGKQLHVMEIEP